MVEIRNQTLEQRKVTYFEKRIRDQKNWYLAKAKYNRIHFRSWVSVCVFLQVAAISLALLRIAYNNAWGFWPTEPILVAASLVIGWIQMKKYSELSSAYGLTANDIGIIEGKLSEVDAEAALSEFVNEAERAFSREHTQWVARQNN